MFVVKRILPMVLLRSLDNEIICIPDEYTPQSFLLSNILSCTKVLEPVPVQVSVRALELILQLMSQNDQVVNKDYDVVEIRMSPHILSFLEHLDDDQLGSLTNAANYLSCPVILELTCKFIADKMQNRSLDELKSLLGVEKELSDESKAVFENDFGWMSSNED